MHDLSATTAERSPTENEQLPLACPRDGTAMTLVRVNPKLGALPELRTYRCPQCDAVETIEVKPLAWTAA